MPKQIKPVIERLFAKTNIPLDENGMADKSKCWVWQGATTNSGYGLIKYNMKVGMRLVTRVVKEFFDPINYSDTVEIQHMCANKLCVNPDHLYIGTPDTRFAYKKKSNITCWMWTQDPMKTCDKCGETTHKLWFSRKHAQCTVS